MKYSISAYDNAGNYAKNDNAGNYFPDTAPKFPSNLVLLFLIVVTLMAVTMARVLWTRKSEKS
jgi:hypothetical protein